MIFSFRLLDKTIFNLPAAYALSGRAFLSLSSDTRRNALLLPCTAPRCFACALYIGVVPCFRQILLCISPQCLCYSLYCFVTLCFCWVRLRSATPMLFCVLFCQAMLSLSSVTQCRCFVLPCPAAPLLRNVFCCSAVPLHSHAEPSRAMLCCCNARFRNALLSLRNAMQCFRGVSFSKVNLSYASAGFCAAMLLPGSVRSLNAMLLLSLVLLGTVMLVRRTAFYSYASAVLCEVQPSHASATLYVVSSRLRYV